MSLVSGLSILWMVILAIVGVLLVRIGLEDPET